MQYEELPWEWTWTRGLAVRRTFLGGPIQWLDFSWRMEAKGKGSLLHVTVEALPRYAVMKPLVWLNLKQAASGMASLATEIEAHIATGAPSPFLKPITPADPGALERALADLARRGVSEPIVKRLRTTVGEFRSLFSKGLLKRVVEAEAFERLPPELRAAVAVSAPFEATVKGVTHPIRVIRARLKSLP